MNVPPERILKRHLHKHFFEVKRRNTSGDRLLGFIVGYSDSLILFHRLEGDTFSLCGHSAVRWNDVYAYRAFDKRSYWDSRAVAKFGITPSSVSNANLSSLRTLVESIGPTIPLITIRTERKRPDVCFIGKFEGATETTLAIDELNADCEWTGLRRIKMADVTRIDFGGGYERALAATAPKTKPKNR